MCGVLNGGQCAPNGDGARALRQKFQVLHRVGGMNGLGQFEVLFESDVDAVNKTTGKRPTRGLFDKFSCRYFER